MSHILSGWRSWKSAKAVTLLAAAALAVGIGSATAIFSVVRPVLLKPLPWAQGERFVSLFGKESNQSGFSSNSWLDLLDYQRRTRSFDRFGIYQPRVFSLTSPGEPQHLNGVEVTPSLARSLGVNPIVGRWFDEAANEGGSVYRAVLSSALWKRLGGSPNIIGQALTMDGRQYIVIGVMPAWFRLPASGTGGEEIRSDVWVPLNPQGSDRNRDVASYFCYARLAPGVTLAQANADVKRVAAELAKENPKIHPGYTAFVISVRESMIQEIRPTLLLLFGAAVVLLLITFANVARLLLARSVEAARRASALRWERRCGSWRCSISSKGCWFPWWAQPAAWSSAFCCCVLSSR